MFTHLKKRLQRRSRRHRLDALVASDLPPGILPAARALAGFAPDAVAKSVARVAERRRDLIAARSGAAPVWYSPKPGTDAATRLEPGEQLALTWDQIAHTGKSRLGATVLYLLGRSFEVKQGLELGSCAGISGIYLASIPTMRSFVTVEGSPALAAVARESLAGFDNSTVLNALFSSAIDQFVVEKRRFDFAFIDGHHEQQATVQYFERLRPLLVEGALVVFDDIRWSEDMFAAWNRLRIHDSLAHAIDLGHIGVGIMKSDPRPSAVAPLQWDLSFVIDDLAISKPWGWKD